MCGSNL
jgi:hypothetical protein